MSMSRLQSSAARALLGRMTFDEVAKASGIGKYTIMRYEQGTHATSTNKINQLQDFYESMGLEFLEHDGVRRKPSGSFRELKGTEGFKEFIYDVYETIKDKGGKICVTNVKEQLFERWQGPHAKDYLSKMATVENLTFQILVEEGDQYFTASDYAEYRYLPSQYFSSVPTYVYGDKKAEIIFDDDDVTVLLLDNDKSADAQRKFFSVLWEKAKPV